MQLLRKIIDLPELKEEKEKLLKLKVKIEEIAKSENSSPEEIYDIKEEDGKIIDYKVIGYKPQMKVLDFVCETIAKEFNGEFANKEEVFQEFLKANFNNQLINIGRLVEKTFGEGSFRIISAMTEKSTMKETNSTIEALEKNKRRFVRGQNQM